MPTLLSVDDLAVVLRALDVSARREAAIEVLRYVPVGPDVIRAAALRGVSLPDDYAVRRTTRPTVPSGRTARAERLRRELLSVRPSDWPRQVHEFVMYIGTWAEAGRVIADVADPVQILALALPVLERNPDDDSLWATLRRAAPALTGVPPDPASSGDDAPYESLALLLVRSYEPDWSRYVDGAYDDGGFMTSEPPDEWEWSRGGSADATPPYDEPLFSEALPGLAAPPDEERKVYARLDAPDVVAPGTEFVVFVGLGESPQTGIIAAPFAVPAESFTLGVQVLAEGFRVLGEGLTRQLAVSGADPYPFAMVRLVAEDTPDLRAERAVQAVYTIDGQIVGVASRIVRVGDRVEDAVPEWTTLASAGPAPAPDVAPAAGGIAGGADWVVPSDPDTQPDLEVIVAPGNDTAGNRLVWYLRSPHRDVPLPAEPVRVLTGGTNAEWARGKMRGVEDRRGAVDRAHYLRGVGYEIAQAMPDAFWTAVRAVAARCAPRPPTVLLASWEPYIPWELATVDDPWDAEHPAVLGGQTVLGRWTYQEQQRTPAPPATLDLDTMAVVTGRYERAPRLPEAEAEAADLAVRYGAEQVEARLESVLAVLSGDRFADVLHVALHGKLDVTGTQDGLQMLDGSWLSPISVRGVGESPIRMVFLNACQVGQGQQALGEPAGMAAALVGIGAGAVVAPLWKVDDAVARDVAERFYPAVWAGESPAAYLRRLRGGPLPDDTVSAYVYFGHPRLQVRWRGRDDSA